MTYIFNTITFLIISINIFNTIQGFLENFSDDEQMKLFQWQISRNALKYCNLLTKLDVKSIKLSKYDKTVSLVFDSDIYSLIISITNNDFPVIAVDYELMNDFILQKYPKEGWAQSNQTNTIPYNSYIFNESYYWKHNCLIGSDKVWLGCPQPMCISVGIDTIFTDINGVKYIFRGRHYWEIKVPINPSTALSITMLVNAQMPVGYYDTSFIRTKNNEKSMIYLIKGNRFWCTSSNFYSYFWWTNKMSKIFNEYPNDGIDAAFYQTLDNEERVYFFKNTNYWITTFVDSFDNKTNPSEKLRLISGPNNILELNPNLPERIDAIDLNNDNEIVIYSEWNYYKFENGDNQWLDRALSTAKLEKKWTFDLFECEQSIYESIGYESYDEFISKIAEKSICLGSNYYPKDESAWNHTLYLMIILLFIFIAMNIITFIVITMIKLNRKESNKISRKLSKIERKNASKKSDSDITENRAQNIPENTAQVSNDNVLENKENDTDNDKSLNIREKHLENSSANINKIS